MSTGPPKCTLIPCCTLLELMPSCSSSSRKVNDSKGAVYDQTHCTVRTMRAHVDDGLGEARVAHSRHRDEQLADQSCRTGLHVPFLASCD